jgi:hypothetical protein
LTSPGCPAAQTRCLLETERSSLSSPVQAGLADDLVRTGTAAGATPATPAACTVRQPSRSSRLLNRLASLNSVRIRTHALAIRAGGQSPDKRTAQNDRKQKPPRRGALRGAKRDRVGDGRAMVHRCAIWIVWRAGSRSECVQSWQLRCWGRTIGASSTEARACRRRWLRESSAPA